MHPQGPCQGGGGLGDDDGAGVGAGTDGGADEAHGVENARGLPDRRPGDAELLGEGAFTWEFVTDDDLAGA